MSLWGNKEVKGATGTLYINSQTGAVVGYGTLFDTQLEVGNYIRPVGQTYDYLVTNITGSTGATVYTFSRTGGAANGAGATGTAGSTGLAYTVSEKPCYVVSAESTDGLYGPHGNPTKVYGISKDEMFNISVGDGSTGISSGATGLRGVQHAGWVRKLVGTGGRAGRIQYETLVAMGTITGDADGNEFP